MQKNVEFPYVKNKNKMSEFVFPEKKKKGPPHKSIVAKDILNIST